MKFFWAISVSLLLSLHVSNGDQANASSTKPKTFIVSVQNDAVPANFITVEDWYKSILSGISPSSSILYSYTAAFHGFTARLTAGEAQRLQAKPAVLHVFEDQLYKPHTTRTPLFLGLNYSNEAGDGIVNGSDEGSSVVIGLIDTGIWPERRSFSDHDLPAVPPTWKGKCEGGANFPKSLCNRKLVGARFFNAGLKAMVGKNVSDSARDEEGHGTHTASTAAGRAAGDASFFGLAAGVATGIAPKARIAAYRVCYKAGCTASDILAGMDKAIADGVDIISISLGSSSPMAYHSDLIAIGAFSAVEKGIFVSASAGNSGPFPARVINSAPWLSTIGAGGIDRKFPADVVLETGEVITGVSLYNEKPHETKFFPLVYDNDYCNTDKIPKLGSDKVRDNIVVCVGFLDGPYLGRLLAQKGGAGVVVANRAADGEGLLANPYTTPGLDIPYSQTQKLLSYMNSTGAPMGKMRFHGTAVGVRPAPVVAFFSSRGPNLSSKFVLKPDVIAPGLNILAAWPYNVSLEIGDTRITELNIMSGTSMSCPHVSGIAAMLKAAHPEWSPAMIRSALTTTAYLKDRDSKPLKDQFSYKDATIWDTGAGHVDPERANDPGLVYDVKVEEYIDFLCASNYSEADIYMIAKRNVSCSGKTSRPWDLNYPAILVDSDGGSAVDAVVKRAVTNVGNTTRPVTYKVEVRNPRGTTVIVDPPELEFSSEGETQRFEAWIKGEKDVSSSWFDVGGLIWSDGNHTVSSPIVVMWGNPVGS